MKSDRSDANEAVPPSVEDQPESLKPDLESWGLAGATVSSTDCVVTTPSEFRDRVAEGNETLNPFQLSPRFPYFPAPVPTWVRPTRALAPEGTYRKALAPTVAGGEPRSVTVLREVAPANAEGPIDVTESGIVTELSEAAPANAKLPIETTELGMTKDVRAVPQKAISPIVMTEFGIVTEVRDRAPSNICVEIDVIKLGRVTDVSETAPAKAEPPIDVTEFGIAIEVSSLASKKAREPIEVTEFGMVTVTSPVPENAACPIEVTEFGIVTDVSDLAPSNAIPAMEVTPAGMLAWPVQLERLTTTLFVTVKVPLIEQLITWVLACAGEAPSPDSTNPRIAIADSLRFIRELVFFGSQRKRLQVSMRASWNGKVWRSLLSNRSIRQNVRTNPDTHLYYQQS